MPAVSALSVKIPSFTVTVSPSPSMARKQLSSPHGTISDPTKRMDLPASNVSFSGRFIPSAPVTMTCFGRKNLLLAYPICPSGNRNIANSSPSVTSPLPMQRNSFPAE